MRTILDAENANLVVFKFNFVMLGVNRNRVACNFFRRCCLCCNKKSPPFARQYSPQTCGRVGTFTRWIEVALLHRSSEADSSRLCTPPQTPCRFATRANSEESPPAPEEADPRSPARAAAQ